MIIKVNSEQEVFTLADGKDLKVTYYGDLVDHKAVVLVGAAMGVSENFYKDISLYLQNEGFLAITFNYTGIGSDSDYMCKTNYGMLDWAQKNIDFLVLKIKQEFPNSKLVWLAHSASGQMLGLCNASANIDKVISVSAGIGYWRLNAPVLKKKVLLFWHLIMPISIFMFGYFPGKRLKLVGDLPKKAAYDWRAACLKKNYLKDTFPEYAKNYENLTAPIVAFFPEDDEMISCKSVENLNKQYVNSASKIVLIKGEDLGVKRIGHMGLFRKSFKNNFWKNYILPELTNI